MEPGPSDGDGTSPLEKLERPRAEDDAIPGPSGSGGVDQPDGELPVLTDTGEDQLQTDSGADKQ